MLYNGEGGGTRKALMQFIGSPASMRGREARIWSMSCLNIGSQKSITFSTRIRGTQNLLPYHGDF